MKTIVQELKAGVMLGHQDSEFNTADLDHFPMVENPPRQMQYLKPELGVIRAARGIA